MFWTNERLEQAAYDELARHGGNQGDLDLLRTEFVKRRYDKSGNDDNERS
jgi:hypothetical protein